MAASSFLQRFVRHLLRGLLILAPAGLTVYFVVALVRWLDDALDVGYPGLGIVLVAALVALVGWLGSSFVVRPLLVLVGRLMNRTPLVGIVYTSVRDLLEAFVGDNQKFNQPCLVQVTEGSQAYRIGFLTQEAMDNFALPEMAAVYFPDSYNFSGELLLVPRAQVTLLQLPSAEVMKFIVSGGVVRVGMPAVVAAPTGQP